MKFIHSRRQVGTKPDHSGVERPVASSFSEEFLKMGFKPTRNSADPILRPCIYPLWPVRTVDFGGLEGSILAGSKPWIERSLTVDLGGL
jgi:hypothetical protein